MGKKPQRHDWPEAKKLCLLNQDDIAMAKRLGFGPDSLIRARPDPRQKWKLPVKYWIRGLHLKRFGNVPGDEPPSAPLPPTLEYDEEAARLYGEELYREEYRERNEDAPARKHRPRKPSPAAATPATADEPQINEPINYDKDVPF